jgi:hypothetical protein
MAELIKIMVNYNVRGRLVSVTTLKVKTKLFKSEKLEVLEDELNAFLSKLPASDVIDVKYVTIPLAIATHTEYGVYPNVEYSPLVIYNG